LKVINMVKEKSTHRRERWRWTRSSVKSSTDGELAFKMQQESKVHWRYEWPLKRTTRWPVQKLLARRQQQVLKRWLRHAENLSHKGKRSGKSLIDFQVGNEKGSVDLVNCQVGRGDIPDFQVGKGEEMSSAESSHLRGC
jgi:hypothetical protein